MQNKLLTAKAALPDYDRTKLVPRIVHLGFGAFHRAHQGVYADILAADHGSDWGYCEVNLIGGEQQIADLKQQDNLYTVAEMSADAWTARVVGVVKNALHAQVDGLERVLPFSGDRSIDVRQPDDCRRSTKSKTAKNCARRCG